MAFLELLLFTIFMNISSNCNAQSTPLTPSGEYCNNQTFINTTSQVSANIDIVLAKLVLTVAINNGYSIASIGGNAGGVDTIYSLAQCREDVNSTDCFLCIQDAAKQIRQRCPNQADSRIWYDTCFLRYNTIKFYGQVDTSFGIIISNVANVTEQAEVFDQKLGALMNKVGSRALVPSNKRFGSGKAKISPSDSVYGLVQCTRDLSPFSCAQCLNIAIGNFATISCYNKQGCQVLYSSCNVRYELYPFFFDPQH